MSASWHTRTPTEGNPIVFFDVSMGGQPLGRVKMELFADVAPRTCENFRQFCTGDHRDRHTKQPIGYKGCSFHRGCSALRAALAQAPPPQSTRCWRY